jgi:hypothetical protein
LKAVLVLVKAVTHLTPRLDRKKCDQKYKNPITKKRDDGGMSKIIKNCVTSFMDGLYSFLIDLSLDFSLHLSFFLLSLIPFLVKTRCNQMRICFKSLKYLWDISKIHAEVVTFVAGSLEAGGLPRYPEVF